MRVSSVRPRNERARRPGAVIQEASHVHDLDGVAGWCPLESSLTSKEIGRRGGRERILAVVGAGLLREEKH
jgi:hypothetical protein